MQVIATAGHVDHGKSALLRALTGMEPDRWAEERRRGLTIDLGFAWMTLPTGEQLAFVDVPGHARFVPNMLAGVGPVPAVLFVVAADAGWMPQSAEHLAAIDALGICRGLLAVTRSDLADPGPALAQATATIRRSSLGEVPAVAVSAVTGAGLPELISALGSLTAGLPAPDPDAPVRIWVDRAFSITGSGTVVTGTLPAGTVSRDDELLVTPALRPVRIRGLQSLGLDAPALTGVSRAALNLRGISRGELRRGMALVQPGRWTLTKVIDVRLSGAGSAGDWGTDGLSAGGRSAGGQLLRQLILHIGSARTPARVRLLGRALARLTLREPVPLHVGDRVLLRDPGAARTHGSRVVGAVVLDVAPPGLAHRGAAAAAAASLASWPDRPTAADLLARHRLLRTGDLLAMGIGEQPAPVAGDWLVDPPYLAALRRELELVAAEHARANPLAAGMPVEAARAALRLPDRRLVHAIAAARLADLASSGTGPLRIADGLITSGPAGQEPDGPTGHLPPPLAAALAALHGDLAARPFHAPDAARLRELGLDSRGLATAARHGTLLRLSEQVVLGPGADRQAAKILAGLDQPFTAATATAALGSTRRTVIPLLEHLDRLRITERLPDDRRAVR